MSKSAAEFLTIYWSKIIHSSKLTIPQQQQRNAFSYERGLAYTKVVNWLSEKSYVFDSARGYSPEKFFGQI